MLSIDMGEIPLVANGKKILYAVYLSASAADSNWGLSIFIVWSSAFRLNLAIPCYVLEQRRPGQPLPPGKSTKPLHVSGG